MASLPPLERGLRIIELAAEHKNGISWKQAHETLDGVSTATTSKILKVLVEQQYLKHEDGVYKPYLKMTAMGGAIDCIERLCRLGPRWSDETATQIGASVVIALLAESCVEFVGASVVEGSLAFSGIGITFPYTNAHILTQIHHVQCQPDNVKRQFDNGILSFEPQGNNPDWQTYVKAIQDGLTTGIFYEYSWKFAFFYRFAVPFFSGAGELVGALMTGFKTRELLEEHKQQIFDCTVTLNARLTGNENSFQQGMDKLRQKGNAWLIL